MRRNLRGVGPPGGIGDDPPDPLNVVLATIRLLVDLQSRTVLTGDDYDRMGALLAACRRYRKQAMGS